jgi:hypothetical protein
MLKPFLVAIFGLLIAGCFLAWGAQNWPLHGPDALVIIAGMSLFGLIGVVALIVGIVKAVGSQDRGAQVHDDRPRERTRNRPEPELVEETPVRITVRTAEGRAKVYKLASTSPADLKKALEQLRAKGHKVVNIEDAG